MEGGTRCATAVPSSRHPGAATKECDVCTCTQTGISNGFGQANVGCGNHLQDGDFYCWTAVRFPSFGTLFRSPPPLCVQGGSKCPDATPRDWAGYRPCDPCGCTVDSRSGKLKVPFNGCGNHADRGLNGNPWCYVAGGTACKAAHADPSLPGSAWKACADQNCQCVDRTAASDVQWSGVVEIKVSERGCGDHDSRGYDWCWVKKGTGCATATPATDPSMKTAAWQKCSSSACDCALDRSDLPDTAVPLGCAPHFAKRDGDDAGNVSSGIEISTDVCYVKGGIGCSRNAVSDSVIPDVAWRYCSQDCYGVGSSFSPATRAACSCFNESKPGTILAARRAPHPTRRPALPGSSCMGCRPIRKAQEDFHLQRRHNAPFYCIANA